MAAKGPLWVRTRVTSAEDYHGSRLLQESKSTHHDRKARLSTSHPHIPSGSGHGRAASARAETFTVQDGFRILAPKLSSQALCMDHSTLTHSLAQMTINMTV